MATSQSPDPVQLNMLRGMKKALKNNPGSLLLMQMVKDYEETLKTLGQSHQVDMENWHRDAAQIFGFYCPLRNRFTSRIEVFIAYECPSGNQQKDEPGSQPVFSFQHRASAHNRSRHLANIFLNRTDLGPQYSDEIQQKTAGELCGTDRSRTYNSFVRRQIQRNTNNKEPPNRGGHYMLGKGWSGRSQIYINTKEKRAYTPFTMTEFRAIKQFPDVEVVSNPDRTMVDAIDMEFEAESNKEPNRNIDDLHQRLLNVEKFTASSNSANWVDHTHNYWISNNSNLLVSR